MLVSTPPARADDLPAIANDRLRVRAVKLREGLDVVLETRQADGSWRQALSTSAAATGSPWDARMTQVSENPSLEWRPAQGEKVQTAEAFFDAARVEAQALVLSGRVGPQHVEQRFVIEGPRQVHVSVAHRVDDGAEPIELAQLMSRLYFTPDGKSFGAALPLDLAWLPNLHRQSDDVCGDHFFRSPAAIVVSEDLYAAIVPDLDVLSSHIALPHAMDFSVFGARAEAPCLSYGLCSWKVDGHTYTRHDPQETTPVAGASRYAFDLFLGPTDRPLDVTRQVATHLWTKYGRPRLADIRPQVLPFEEYGRRYAYKFELPRWATTVTIDGSKCVGIDNPARRGANFHAWENDLHVAFGVGHYGAKWKDAELARTATGILRLSMAAPTNAGAFPCIYNFSTMKYEGSLHWTARSADAVNGFDSQAMGVSAWWRLAWHAHVEQARRDSRILASVVEYARFLRRAQLPSGAIPTYFNETLQPQRQLRESATTALSGAVLAKAAMLSGDKDLAASAIAAGRFMETEILPKLLFQDFEVFYSCSPKPLSWVDDLTGLPPINTLAVQCTADQFLALHQLTNDAHWLQLGEDALGVLSLFQQVWSPPDYEANLFGGFGAMNTDGEWSDGRGARFVSTYADYYSATGKLEYLERAVAACRAAFALMDIEENHRNGINTIEMSIGLGQGYAPENVLHSGPGPIRKGLWTGFNWGAGGALAASAYLERTFGSVWVDGQAKQAVAIDGVTANVSGWSERRINLTVACALKALSHPYDEERTIVVKFGRMPPGEYDVTINDQPFPGMTSKQLAAGLQIALAGQK